MKPKSPKGSLKPRNGFVGIALLRGGAGAHGKTNKAQRKADKVRLAKRMEITSDEG